MKIRLVEVIVAWSKHIQAQRALQKEKPKALIMLRRLAGLQDGRQGLVSIRDMNRTDC